MSRRLRVSLVAERAGDLDLPGPGDTPTSGLATELAGLGVEVTVLARCDGGPATAPATVAPGVEVDLIEAGPVRPLAEDQAFAHMPAFANRLRQRWLARPPDLVHALSWTTGWAARSAGTGAPIVQALAGLGGSWRRRRRDLGRGAGVSSFERRRVETGLLAGAAHVVVPCGSDVGAIEAAAGPEIAARLSVVPLGVDPEVFRPDGPTAARAGGEALAATGDAGRERCVSRVRHRLLAHGPLVPRAGVDIVVGALVQLPDAELVVAGGPDAAGLDGDPEVRRLRGLARRCGVGDRVCFTGRVPRSEVAALVRSADLVVCVPWHSRMGVTPIEALACGRPVVGSTVAGVPDALVPGRTGLLVPPRSPEALAAAVAQLLANPSLRRRMGEEGVARVRQQHTWPLVARSLHEIYRSVTAPVARGPVLA
jgi:glycosyltransferase involved in cell wall biosynthesis